MLKTQMKQAPLQVSNSAGIERLAGSNGSSAETQAGALAVTQAKASGWLPELSVTAALGLVLIAFTNYGAYTGAAWATPLFWLGLLVLLLPPVYRLSRRTRRGANGSG